MKRDTLRRCRTPTTVVTANGELPTNEEAHGHVHDLDLFVTVQLPDNTPAVLPLGKLCSEQGYAYACINGQDPHLTQNGKTITSKMDNCVLLVVPGLSSSSSSSSASTSRPKDQSNFSGESETSSDPMTTRSAKHACGKPMQTNPDEQASGNRVSAHKEDEMNEEDPTQGIPDWLQSFTDNLEELDTHVPAHSPERAISDSEGDASKLETQKRKHSICSHFTKDRNYDICLRTKITRVPCRRRNEGSIPRAEKLGDLITTDHKVLNVGSESRNNHQYAARTRIHRRRRRVYESFWSRHKSHKLCIRTIH